MEGREDDADAADDEVGWHFVRPQSDELDRVVEFNGTEDEPIAGELREPEMQCVADTHGEDRGLGRLVGNGRIVVAIDDNDGLRGQQRLHACGLLAGNAHGDEAHPGAADGGATGPHLLEQPKRDLEMVKGGGSRRHRVMDRGTGSDDGYEGVAGAVEWTARELGWVIQSEQVRDGEQLSGEQAIQCAEAEGAAPAQKVGDVRGLKAGLPGQERAVKTAAVDPAKEFHPETLLQLREIHCGKLAR